MSPDNNRSRFNNNSPAYNKFDSSGGNGYSPQPVTKKYN
jgi:hypothetical protein